MEPTYTHCVVCGKPLEFPDRRPFILRTKKYCGKKCKSIAISARHRQKVRESRNPQEPVHTHCETCGKPLEFPNPTGAVLRTKRFCSRRCGEIARRKQKREAKLANAPPPNHNRCEICGKPLEFPDKRGHVLKKKRFCSKKCKNVAADKRRKEQYWQENPLPEFKICPECNQKFYRKENQEPEHWSAVRFCSRLCQQCAYRREHEQEIRENGKVYRANLSDKQRKRKNQRASVRRKERYWKDPQKARARGRAEYQKRRERILAILEQKRRAQGVQPQGETISKPTEQVAEFYQAAFPNHEILFDHPMLKNPDTGYPLRFDIWIPEEKLAIEVDGPFHREPIFGEEKLKRTQYLDALKDRLAAEAGIHLIRIPVE